MPGARSFLLTVDVEPDDRVPEDLANAPWTGLEVAIDRLERFRSRVARSTGITPRFSWFVRADPQIGVIHGDPSWAMTTHRRLFEALARRGDEIGLHVHPFRWSPAARTWTIDNADSRWILECVRSGLAAYRRVFGAPARAFRFGDRWMSNHLIKYLEREGIRWDLTLESGMKSAAGMSTEEHSTGSLPDFRAVPRAPYRPSRAEYRAAGWKRDRRRLWIVPVTTGCVNGPVFPDRVEDRHDMVHFNLALPPAWIGPIGEGALTSDQPVIVSVARTGDLVLPGALENFDRNLESIASHGLVGRRGVRFTTPRDFGRHRV